MEETLGKRIVRHRKRLGLTQDQLAEQLGLTAQAISKWEHDLSCPDITMLPRLARIFGITTDALLGIEPESPAREAELVTGDDGEPEGLHVSNGNWEFRWDGGRKNGIGFAVLVLLVGSLMLAGNWLGQSVSFWGLLWPCALLVFGLWGLYPRPRFFRLGCVLFGGYFLAEELGVLPSRISGDLVFPAILVLFGLSLLCDVLGKPRGHRFHVHDTDGHKFSSSCDIQDERFTCGLSFGNDCREIAMPRLSGGTIDCSFGELTVDLTGCEEIAPGGSLTADCSFGSITIRVPCRFRLETAQDTNFGSIETSGHPAPDAVPIRTACAVSFGSIRIEYI